MASKRICLTGILPLLLKLSGESALLSRWFTGTRGSDMPEFPYRGSGPGAREGHTSMVVLSIYRANNGKGEARVSSASSVCMGSPQARSRRKYIGSRKRWTRVNTTSSTMEGDLEKHKKKDRSRICGWRQMSKGLGMVCTLYVQTNFTQLVRFPLFNLFSSC